MSENVALYQAEPPAITLNSIALKLSNSEWKALCDTVLTESHQANQIKDKYMRALLYPLLKQVFKKLHNKLHSLKAENNSLSLTLPEASVLAAALLEMNSDNYLIIRITSFIDQKLT